MSAATVLGVCPGRLPVDLLELRNSHGWASNICDRLIVHHGMDLSYSKIVQNLDALFGMIDDLPGWQQAPLILTADLGVIPWQDYGWAAEMIDEFEARLPSNPNWVNHAPAVADLLRSGPEAPFVGIYQTSVTDNPFSEWSPDIGEDGGMLPSPPIDELMMLRRHRELINVVDAEGQQ
jgi:hypothetical protein